jgi:glycosyltransferase involved in cell wall biosynthesis
MKVLFCHCGLSTFVLDDIEILRGMADVRLMEYKAASTFAGKLANLFISFFQALFLVPRCKVVYSFFVGYHSFFPVIIGKLLGKKTVAVVGGFDAVCMPSIQYGVFCKKGLQRWCVTQIYKKLDYILPVDASLIQSVNAYAADDAPAIRTGFREYISDIKGNVIEVPFGFDSELFVSSVDLSRKSDVISVALIENGQDILRKGFDLIVEAARILPDVNFTLVGITQDVQDTFFTDIPKNVTIHPPLPRMELIPFYSRHKVFLQVSLSEGLPNTLCEAMLCGCIPVGSNVNGIPKAIGDTGFILEKKDKEILAEYILKSLALDDTAGSRARQRIMDKFPVSRRVEAVKKIIAEN